MRVVVSGATGLVGTKLCERLVARSHEVYAFTRDASRSRDHLHPRVKVLSWAAGATAWEQALDGAGGVVNLAGESLARRWTKSAKARIVGSRVAALEKLYGAAEKAEAKPPVLVSASAVGYYGTHGDEELTEESPPGQDFLAETCVKWERAALRFEPLGTRVARMRIGLVVGPDAVSLKKMSLPFRFFAGGRVGSGKQWVSWIHLEDLADLLVFALENAGAQGAVNATAPNPVRNADFAEAMGRALHRPSVVPMPAAAMKAIAGEMSMVALEGQRVLPARALELGFTHRFPEIGPAMKDALS